MAIVALKKITLYGTANQKEGVLDSLQALGCLHLLNLGPEADRYESRRRISGEIREVLKYLQACPLQRRPVTDPTGFDFAGVEAETLRVQRREQELQDERDRLQQAIAGLKPWGEFQLPPPREVGGLRFWFYVVPHHRVKMFRSRTEDLIWQVVSRDHRFEYVVVLNPHEPPGLPIAPVELDERPLSQLMFRLEELELELEDLYWQRVSLTRWTRLLSRMLAAAEDRDLREQAAEQTRDEAGLFALQGWIPSEHLPRLREFCDRHVLALTVEAPAGGELPPTLLKNPEPLAGGEEAVRFYMTPGYRMWDPSPVVFFSFTLFFAMIFADAGYGLLLGLVLLLVWGKLGTSHHGVRIRNLTVALVVASVGYGVLVGSYFGGKPSPGTLLGSLHVLDSREQAVMMRLSIVIGVLHVGLAHVAIGWHYRRSFRVLSSVGWGSVLLGGLIAGLGITGTAPEDQLVRVGVTLLAIGGTAVLLFSSDRPFPSIQIRHLAGRLFDGLKALTGVSRAFGDVLSYLRLFALGLASTQLAVTFNGLASQARGYEGVGILLAMVIILLGHGLNFALATLSGVVHGLRLNYIEFFNWGLPEEGYPFRAFCKQTEQ